MSIRPTSAACAAALALAAFAGFTGCTDSLSSGSRGTVQVRMTDSPADFDAVNVVITEVQLHQAGAPDSSGWETIKRDSTQYDLLQLRNGVFTTLGIGSVPAGRYTQLRLVLGSGSHVVVAGVPIALTLSSEAQTGLKINGTWEVTAGETLNLGLDFDAGRSITLTGVGHYMLRPVVRVVSMDAAGSISGTVSAGGGAATVTAMQGSTVVASTETGADGRFTLSALPSGTYSLALDASLVAYRDSTIAGVVVQARSTTQVGVCALPMAP